MQATRLQIDAAVSYQGTQIHEYLDEADKVACPLLLHMAEQENNYSTEEAGHTGGSLPAERCQQQCQRQTFQSVHLQ